MSLFCIPLHLHTLLFCKLRHAEVRIPSVLDYCSSNERQDVWKWGKRKVDFDAFEVQIEQKFCSESNLNLSIMTSFFYFWPNFIVKEWRWKMLQADSNLCCPQEHQSISCTICFLFKAIHTNEHSLGCCCTELWRKSGHFCLPLHREDKSKRFIFKRQSFPSGRDYCIFFTLFLL